MRLASKIFVASSLVILVLLGVGALSLLAVGRLVSVNRAITTRTVPAVRHATAARDAMLSLARLEARLLVLGDLRFAALWEERAARAGQDLEWLGDSLTTPREVELLRAATTTFEQYRLVVLEEQALLRRGQRARARGLAEISARPLAERVESSLEQLLEATEMAAVDAHAEAARLEARTWLGVVIALGTAVALAFVSTGIIAFRLMRSLRALSAATAAVAAGSFHDPLPVGGRDELAELSRSFNAMAAQLKQLDELKQSFLATVSHELRSPLTSMREAAHLLRDRIPGELSDKQARLVTIIGRSSDRLLRLVNQILDLSRLRAGTLVLNRQRLDLYAVVGRALDELRPQAEEAGVGLERERQGANFAFVGDEDRLIQVVVNLVANAIRFTPRGGRVIARLIDAGDEVEIQVEDTGIGMSPIALTHLFDAYPRAHSPHRGAGLGLPIVRGIVEAHGGRVTVESQEGKGSRFSALLPRRREST